jgi:hypothetical protein
VKRSLMKPLLPLLPLPRGLWLALLVVRHVAHTRHRRAQSRKRLSAQFLFAGTPDRAF